MSAFLLALALLAAPQEPALVRSQVSTDAPVWVGQRVRFDVRLLVPNQFSGTPTFDVPAVEHAIFVRVGGSNSRPTFGSERVGGKSYTSATYGFAVFFQESGAFEIPPFEVRFAGLEGFGADPEWHALSTESHRVEVRSPPGTERLAVVVSTTRLDVEDRWDRGTDGAQVGDAFRRRIRMSAPDVSGLLLPALPLDRVTGLAAHPADPVVETESARGAFRGSREEDVTYVCEEPGTAVVPPLVVRWWNLDAGTLESIELAGASFEVAPAPSAPPGEEAELPPPVGSAEGSSFIVVGGLVLALVGVVGALCFALWRRFYGPLSEQLQARRLRAHASEAGCFRALTSALDRDDPAASMAALYRWLGARSAVDRTATLRGFAGESADPEMLAELEALESAVLGAAATGGTPWRGAPLARRLARERARHGSTAARTATPELPPLNPN
ncbi:MAG: hypothetical protein AAGB93_21775 [Planctomycetota bacterium]